MLFAKRKDVRGQFKPFVLKIRDGFLLGLAPDPIQGAPCSSCVQLWLTDRRVWFETASISDLTIRKDVLLELMSNNLPHVYYEIHRDGTATRLDCIVYPHANCNCNRGNYVPPEKITKKTNFAFSPLQQIKCARYGTPEGNLWLASSTGTSHITGQVFSTYGAARDRERSRLQAVDEWLKKIAAEEMQKRSRSGEQVLFHSLQTGETTGKTSLPQEFDSIGIGSSEEESLLNGLEKFSLIRTLRKYAGQAKNPMLIVGANTWLRDRVPFFMLQQYDLHLLFYPNSTPTWVTGILALSRVRLEEPPLFAFASGAHVNSILDVCLGKILIHCRPSEWNPSRHTANERKAAMASKLHLWWTNWVYRCPKISLRDVLHLEEYGRDVMQWKNYFRDGQEALSFSAMNSPLIPSGIRHLIVLHTNAPGREIAQNLNGIGVWSNLGDSIHV